MGSTRKEEIIQGAFKPKPRPKGKLQKKGQVNLTPFTSFENAEMGHLKVNHRLEDVFEVCILEEGEEGHLGTCKSGSSLYCRAWHLTRAKSRFVFDGYMPKFLNI